MKKCAVCVALVLLLCGCAGKPDEMETALALRSRLLQSEGCSFRTHITADHGEELWDFVLDCTADTDGNVSFTVTEPQTIAGISGKVTGEGGQLLFDDTVLCVPLLADGELSPLSAPWILLKTLRSGYLASVMQQEEGLLLSMDDSFQDDALRVDILLGAEDLPAFADILQGGRRILTVAVKDFAIL